MQPFLRVDVLIAGAGPAGTACALALAKSGLSVAIIDKKVFPRDKICGDAIGGRVKSVLRKIDPDLEVALKNFEQKSISKGWKLVAPNGKEVEVRFTTSGYISKRLDFDYFLYQQVKKEKGIQCIEGYGIKQIQIGNDNVIVLLDDERSIHAEVIIGCDGAHSIVQKSTVGRKVDEAFYSGAVRAYYRNIDGIQPNIIEIHLAKDFLPGYFWIFPIQDGVSNVGFGMLTKDISERKINLKEALTTLIQNSPLLAPRFKNAEAITKPEGFGLPLGGRKLQLSGDRFILCGDAASLIDPLNGEGIGNAMLSGYLAAQSIVKAFENQDFSASQLNSYDRAINEKLIPELRQKLRFQKLFNRPWLINGLVSLGASNGWIRRYIGKKL